MRKAKKMSAENSQPKYIKWKGSAAAAIIKNDLQQGMLDLEEPPANVVWQQTYSKLAEFKDVPFEQFEKRLRDHRQQYARRFNRSQTEEILFQQDRLLNPRQYRNNRGELVIDMHDIKDMLREDMHNGVHIGKTPSELQATRPELYGLVKPEKFKERLYQEIRRLKFAAHLEAKRQKKKEAEEAARQRRSQRFDK